MGIPNYISKMHHAVPRTARILNLMLQRIGVATLSLTSYNEREKFLSSEHFRVLRLVEVLSLAGLFLKVASSFFFFFGFLAFTQPLKFDWQKPSELILRSRDFLDLLRPAAPLGVPDSNCCKCGPSLHARFGFLPSDIRRTTSWRVSFYFVVSQGSNLETQLRIIHLIRWFYLTKAKTGTAARKSSQPGGCCVAKQE